MLLQALNGDKWAIIEFLLTIPVILFSLSFHEAAHAFVADRLGDHTARYDGRLTLNPLHHLDPLGALCMLIVGIGWAKPVPINARNFQNPRKGMMLSSLAGPVSNLFLGICFSILQALAELGLRFVSSSSNFWMVLYVIYLFFYVAAYLNFALAIFNLIPCPPFDGSRIFFYFLPKQWYFKVMRYERYIGIGCMVLFLILSELGFSPVSFLAGGLQSLIYKPLEWLVTLSTK